MASAADEASDREAGSQLSSPHRTESARFPLPVRPSDVLEGGVREVTTLGVLCCFAVFVCLTLLASFFLPSHLSLTTCILGLYWCLVSLVVSLSRPPLSY